MQTLAQNLADLEALRLLIDETTGSLLTFALYQGNPERTRVIEELKGRLNLPVAEFICSKDDDDPVRFLHTLSKDKRTCAFFLEVEDALPALAGYVNLQREAFSTVPHAVVFWVREHGMREIAEKAPGFWAWRSGVFDFRARELTRSTDLSQMELPEHRASKTAKTSSGVLLFMRAS